MSSSPPLISKKAPKEVMDLQTQFSKISPTLYFSITFALSSFLFIETICLLETQAFPNDWYPQPQEVGGPAPLILSNFIIANFIGSFIR